MTSQDHREDRDMRDTVGSLQNLAADLTEVATLMVGKNRNSYLDFEIVALKAVWRTLKYRIDLIEHIAGQAPPETGDFPF